MALRRIEWDFCVKKKREAESFLASEGRGGHPREWMVSKCSWEKKATTGKCFWLFHLLISFSGEVLNENQLIRKENEVCTMCIYVCSCVCAQKFGIIHFNLVGVFFRSFSSIQSRKTQNCDTNKMEKRRHSKYHHTAKN